VYLPEPEPCSDRTRTRARSRNAGRATASRAPPNPTERGRCIGKRRPSIRNAFAPFKRSGTTSRSIHVPIVRRGIDRDRLHGAAHRDRQARSEMMQPTRTYLAPGQRYAQPNARRLAPPVTIIRLVPDPFGAIRVVFAQPGGHEVVISASHVEAAIAGGQLTPIAGPGRIGRCGASVVAGRRTTPRPIPGLGAPLVPYLRRHARRRLPAPSASSTPHLRRVSSQNQPLSSRRAFRRGRPPCPIRRPLYIIGIHHSVDGNAPGGGHAGVRELGWRCRSAAEASGLPSRGPP
jgi:hypothetical protein